MTQEIERAGLVWWVRDAANSICGQTGAKTHQEKLHEAADFLKSIQDLSSDARVSSEGVGMRVRQFFSGQ